MKQLMFLSSLFILLSAYTFKDEQRKYERVREAYFEKENQVKALFEDHSIKINELQVYLRAFKSEKELELWAKNRGDSPFKLIKTYDICNTSGRLGPKRRQGDMQTPEGYYHIDRFNPVSNFHLSLGINYPNPSDKILGVKGKLGGDIFIHGSCVTVGCLPITDEQIKELYIICVEAKNSGQLNIPVTIFPARLSTDNCKQLKEMYGSDNEKINLWADLKKGYDYFSEHKKLPEIVFLENGRNLVAGK